MGNAESLSHTKWECKYHLTLRREGKVRDLVVFTPADSKRFFVKTVASLLEVTHALKNSEIVIDHKSIKVRMVEEITGQCLSGTNSSQAW